MTPFLPGPRPLVPALLGLLIVLPSGGPAVASLRPAPAVQADHSAETSPRELRLRAVEQARAGQLKEALAMLEELHRRHPEDPLVTGDYLVVLQWAGESSRVLELAEGLDLGSAPVYAVEAVARAARDLGRFERAAQLFERAVALRPAGGPDSLAPRLALAATLAEAGRREEAGALAAELEAEHPADPRVLMTAGYVHRRLGEHLEAAEAYHRVLELEPAPDRESLRQAFRLRVLSLADLGAIGASRDLARRGEDHFSGALTAADRHRLRGDLAAQRVRWGGLPPEDAAAPPAQRHAATDRAIEMLQENLARIEESLKGLDTGSEEAVDVLLAARRRALYDLVIALRDRVRMEQTAALVERLAGETPKGREGLPHWVLEAEADALLYLRRPEEAAEGYRRVLEERPQHFEARLGLFYAHVESENFPAALALIDATARSEPVWSGTKAEEDTGEQDAVRGARDSEGRRPNGRRLRADLSAALGRAFYGAPAEAQRFLEPAVARAPRNTGLRQGLATVYRWRGWPRRALAETGLVLALEPHRLGARLGRVAAGMELGHFAAAGEEITELARLYPDNQHVRRAARDWRLATGWEAYLDASDGSSSGQALGSTDRTVDFFLHSPTLGREERLRPFLHATSAEATFPAGEAEYQRLGLGLAWRGAGGWRLTAEAHRRFDDAGDREADPGLTLGAHVPLSDRWSLGARVESQSTGVPLQARRAGIDGQAASLSARYAPNDLGSASLALTRLEMGDGNVRESALLTTDRRWVTRPRYRLGTELELFASTNSRRGAPYYNPSEDRTAHLSAVQEYLHWRRYERSLTHRLVLGGGVYHQEGFGSSDVWTARYEHDWSLSAGYGLRYGFGWSSRVYDGDREDRTWIYLTSLWRF